MYHTSGESILEGLNFLNYRDGQKQLTTKRQSILFYANDNNADGLSAALGPVLSMLKNTGVKKGGLNHVVVLPCWDHWDWSIRQVFDECNRVLHGVGKLNAVYSTAPPAQCQVKVISSSSENTVSDEMVTSEQPSSPVTMRPHLVIGFSFGKRLRSSDASENVPLVSQGSVSAVAAAAAGGDAAGAPVLPSSTAASPRSSLPSIQEQVIPKVNLPQA